MAAAQGATAAESLELRRRAAEQLLRSGHVDRGLAHDPGRPRRGGDDARCRAEASPPLSPSPAGVDPGAGHRIRGARRLPDQRRAVDADRRLLDRGHGPRDHRHRSGERLPDASSPPGTSRGGAVPRRQGARAWRWPTRPREGDGPGAGPNGSGEKRALLVSRVGHPHALGLATFTSGFAEYLEGRWRTAQKLLRAGRGNPPRAMYRGGLGARQRCSTTRSARSSSWDVSRSSRAGFPRISRMSRSGATFTPKPFLRTRVSYSLLLVRDEPVKARQEIREMLARWSHRSYHLQHYYDLHGQAEIDLYEGNPKAAWERISSGWRALERSLLRRAQLVFLESAYLRARTVAGRRGRAGDRRAPYRRSPSATPGGSSAKRMPWSNPLAALFGPRWRLFGETAPTRLLSSPPAESGFEAATRACTPPRPAGDGASSWADRRGATLIGESEAWMSRERVANPARLCALLAPPCSAG